MRSFLLGPPPPLPTASVPRRVHLVCPLNGACTAVALLICELLDAGCISDFSCLMQWDPRRVYRALDKEGQSAEEVRAKWDRRQANLVLKNTISTETASVLTATSTQWALGSSAMFTHRILFLRDPVQQYLSMRLKPWCANCGGFQKKLAAQDELTRRCLAVHATATAASSSSVGGTRRSDASNAACPFDAVVFDFDLLADDGKALPAMLGWLGLHQPNASSVPLAANSRREEAVHISFSRRRARNAALALSPKLVMGGNMRGDTLRPRIASSRRRTWNCEVASRV